MANKNVTLEEQFVIDANNAIKAINNLKKSVTGLKTETSNTGNAIKKGLTFGAVLAGGRKLLNFLKTANSDAMDLIETANLFEVSMGKGVDGLNQYYEKAIKFQNQLSEALGTNINESMNFQALFNSMGTSMGLDRSVAYKISENFTKLGYDLASLYNTETNKAMQKLQSGLSGASTRPLRAFGIDITQSTLSNTLSTLGLDKTIGQLNQAEKMVLRYISVLRQSSIAHGDFARTLESPANQLRIFQAQCLAFRQNIGSLWQGIYARWMPYINGIMMAINALIKVIGGLFGIKFGTSIQTASKSLGTGAVGAGGIADGLDKASGSAKKLKEELDLMPWDEIHNIDLGKDSSSSGGGGGASGGGGGGFDVDPALLKAMGEYDNMMDKVRSKATDIRDRIMEWLGFTKKINPFTNEISWEYTGMSKTAKLILTALKTIVAIGIAKKIVDIIGKIKTLSGVFKGIIAPTTSFQTGLASLGKRLGDVGAFASLAKGRFVELFRTTEGGTLKKFTTALTGTTKEMATLVPVAVKATAGIAGLGLSAYGTFKSMRDFTDGSISATSAIGKLGISMGGAVASGALLGSIIPGIGTGIGALVGGIVGLTGAIIGWRDEGEKLQASAKESKKSIDEYVGSIQKEKEALQDSVNSQLAYVGYVENLVGELDTLVDAEGNVKAGMEDRVNFILNQLNEAMGTEYKLVDGQIEEYDKLKQSIADVIQQKKLEIVLNANEQAYTDAISRRAELQRKIYEEQKKLNDAHQRQHEILTEINNLDPNDFMDAGKMLALANEYNHLAEGATATKENLKTLTQQVGEDNDLIISYETALADSISGNTDKIEEDINRLTNAYSDGTEEIGRSVAEGISEQIMNYESLVKRRDELNKEEFESQATSNQQKLDNLAQTLIDITNTTTASEPGIVEAWRLLANHSEDKYNEYISKLDPETKTAVENALKTLDGKKGDAKKAGEGVASETLKGAKEETDHPTRGIGQIASFLVGGLIGGLSGALTLKSLYNVGSLIIGKVLEGARKKAEEHSPSKAMFRIGDYLTQGLALGIEENANDAVNSVKKVMTSSLREANKFANGVHVNPSEYSIDTNKFIDYSDVTGNIASQIDVTDNISDKVYRAVTEGLQNTTINVGIEAKTEEGVLLKRVQNQARQYRMQTGKAPFPAM